MNEKQKSALMLVIDELTGLLCYQPEVPQQHKQDLVSAVEKFRCALIEEKLAPIPANEGQRP